MFPRNQRNYLSHLIRQGTFIFKHESSRNARPKSQLLTSNSISFDRTKESNKRKLPLPFFSKEELSCKNLMMKTNCQRTMD